MPPPALSDLPPRGSCPHTPGRDKFLVLLNPSALGRRALAMGADPAAVPRPLHFQAVQWLGQVPAPLRLLRPPWDGVSVCL